MSTRAHEHRFTFRKR